VAAAGFELVKTGLSVLIKFGPRLYELYGKFAAEEKSKRNFETFLKELQDFNEGNGFRSLKDVRDNCKDFLACRTKGSSHGLTIAFYGQRKAKERCCQALQGYLSRRESIALQRRASEPSTHRLELKNVLYLLGKSGTGKTTMAMALAEMVLQHYESKLLIIDTNNIVPGVPLGKQLFKTQAITKQVNKAYSMTKSDHNELESGTGEMLSVMLEHIIKCNYTTVVIIENYNQMKTIANPNANDTTADEVLKSISAYGTYTVGTESVNCEDVLFIVTSQETLAEVKKNFGEGGELGGGYQRLNIVELDDLDREACEGIVSDMESDVKTFLTIKEMFRIKEVSFDPETTKTMEEYVLNSASYRGRAVQSLKDSILDTANKKFDDIQGKEIIVISCSNPDSKEEGYLYFQMPDCDVSSNHLFVEDLVERIKTLFEDKSGLNSFGIKTVEFDEDAVRDMEFYVEVCSVEKRKSIRTIENNIMKVGHKEALRIQGCDNLRIFTDDKKSKKCSPPNLQEGESLVLDLPVPPVENIEKKLKEQLEQSLKRLFQVHQDCFDFKPEPEVIELFAQNNLHNCRLYASKLFHEIMSVVYDNFSAFEKSGKWISVEKKDGKKDEDGLAGFVVSFGDIETDSEQSDVSSPVSQEPVDPGKPVGMSNSHHICFFNAVVQQLFRCQEFVAYLNTLFDKMNGEAKTLKYEDYEKAENDKKEDIKKSILVGYLHNIFDCLGKRQLPNEEDSCNIVKLLFTEKEFQKKQDADDCLYKITGDLGFTEHLKLNLLIRKEKDGKEKEISSVESI